MFEPATLTLPTTDGITYAADPAGPYVLLPQVVTVTATLDDAGVGVAGDDADGVDRDGFDDGDVQPVMLQCRAVFRRWCRRIRW